VDGFNRILDVIAQIGATLPAFKKYAGLFAGNTQVHQVLCLFFRDILDFHATLLDFFNHKSMDSKLLLNCTNLEPPTVEWSKKFQSLWPKYAGKLKVVQDNITKHTILMQGEVTLAEITEAHTARTRSLQEYERNHEFQQRQDFEMVLASLAPNLYDQELERLRGKCTIDSTSWLANHVQYQKWFDESDKSTRLLWLEGIPGAGSCVLVFLHLFYCQWRPANEAMNLRQDLFVINYCPPDSIEEGSIGVHISQLPPENFYLGSSALTRLPDCP
jgi:hypothetical protein